MGKQKPASAILGISAFYHDSAAAIIIDGQVIAAAQEERFTRIKHDPSFPTHAIQFCLDYSGYTLNDLDAIVFYDKPFLKFERLLETYYNFSPKGFWSFVKAIPAWVKEKLFLKRIIRQELQAIQTYDQKKVKLLFPEHHLSHAASAFYPSPFEEAAILTIDGVGEWATASICHGKGNKIEVLKEMHFPHSLGLLYSAFTYFLGFKVNSGEYKLMGLAPYGDPQSEQVRQFVKKIESDLITINEDGSILLHQAYFSYATGLRMVPDQKWEKLFGLKKRTPESALEQQHCNLGIAIQQVTEKVVIKMAQEAKRLTGSKNLCLAGGVALNCVANGQLQEAQIFEALYIQPAAGDAGGALGAALAVHHIYFDQQRTIDSTKMDSMSGSYLGPQFSDLRIEQTARKFKSSFTKIEKQTDLSEQVAALIASGNVIGWFQGRMEFGPRALGNRSILGDIRNPEMQKKINLKIKYRESFRPFAPAVLAEKAADYFAVQSISPYMLLVKDVLPERRKKIPADYHSYPLREKLALIRTDIPAVTHVDFSARIQTVHQETNPEFHSLLQAFEGQTDYALLINTSFNVRGEPIVCTPEDAFRCFLQTDMDYLVLGNYIFDKKKQRTSNLKNELREQQFELD